MNKEKVINLIGWLLLLLWVISTITQFVIKQPTTIFWFCNLAIFVLAIACFQRSVFLTYAILAPAFIFQLPWTIDWIISKTTNLIFLNLKEFYQGTSQIIMFIITLRHITIIPVSIFLLFLLKPKKPSRKQIVLSILAVLILFLVSYIQPISHNINCIHRSCIPFLPVYNIVYTLIWIISSILISLIFLFLISKIHKKFNNKINK